MRFKNAVFFKIDDLLLDEENYRFGLAKNQKDCIELIYKNSPENFENLLNDIIANNIGDYPLVFINSKNQNIVLDGNRRVSILKIINNPELAPSKKIADILATLDKNKLPFDLNQIGCFVSSDKQEILKTVYERHAAGKGISRIQWSAFATAKFRYDAEIDDNDWRAIAILLHIISFDENADTLIKKPNFSFEVFRRMIRHAYLNGYLHFEIFNEDKNVINSESDYLNSAIELVNKIVKAIDNSEVGLSRRKNYASEDFLSQYFLHYFTKITESKPPRKKRKNKTIKPENPVIDVAPLAHDTVSNIFTKIDDSVVNNSFIAEPSIIDDPVNTETTSTDETVFTLPPLASPQINLPLPDIAPVLDIVEPSSLIESNIDLINSLNRLSIQKFSLLYQSLSQLSIKKHPILAVIATWAFLDSLPRVGGWEGTDFTSYYNNHIKNMVPAKELQTDIRHSISWLYSEGNCNKHSSKYVTLDYKEFTKHFNNIQTFLSNIIDQKIIPKKSVANAC
ncbi:hypothetical protein B9T23_01920 [Acinetobacter terrae]|uniref:hypothetical protein n=1 Tax=Acinetobacter terrae TaxID=2731247 RepID=UPI000A346C2F|nr:hypothetical protein [Acinetobacter terrae]OTG78850.1 hypothetical protein B9T23_01920 [Acinetobacter terrae]